MKRKITKKQYEQMRSWTREYIDRICIVRNTRMPGKKPGTTYTWMFYLRRGLFNPQFMSAIAQMFLYRVDKEIGHFNFQISGLETAATPMVAGIPLVLSAFDVNINGFIVRKNQKEYGLQNWIEGIPNNKPVMLIDDLCNSGSSMAKCRYILEQHGYEIFPYAFSIVNKSNKGIHDEKRLETDMYLDNIKMISLFTLDDFNLYSPSH